MKPVLACLLALALVALLGPMSPPTLTDYAWTDGALLNHDWDDEYNWFGGGPGFPDDQTDDATIPYTAGDPWDVTLVDADEEIRDLTVEGNVDFTGPDDETVSLTVARLYIDASSGEVVLQIVGDEDHTLAQIIAN